MSKSFYLTFDGAPNPPGTEKILDVLAKYGVKATFFIEGRRLETEAACARRILQENHDIGNHSYNHPDFDTIPLEKCIEEVKKTDQILYDKLGIRTKFLRPPSGKLTKEVEETFRKLGYTIVLWSYSIRDWEGPNPEAIAQRVLEQLKDEAVVVFHDHVQWVPAALELIIPELRKQGYILRKISQHPGQGLIK